MSPNYVSIGGPRTLGTGALAFPPATKVSRLSRALKRLKEKLKKTKNESASLSGETRQADPQCEPALQSTKAAPAARKFPRPASTFTKAALQPEPQPALIKYPKETAQSEPQRELPGAKEVEGQSVVPKAPEKVAQQPSSSGKAPAVNPQLQPAPKPTIIAPKAKPQPTPKATRQTPKPTSKPVSTPKPQPMPKATRQTPKPTSESVSIPKPAVQTHAGLYSGFTPSVAAVDQPAPKTLIKAQKTALDVLYGASPSGSGVPKTRPQYMGPGDYNVAQNIARAALSDSPTMSSEPSYPAGFSNISYASPSHYLSAGPLGTFRTGGPLGGGQYFSTGGAIGGGAIAQTGGRFGEGSVSKTGGSLGEGLGVAGL